MQQCLLYFPAVNMVQRKPAAPADHPGCALGGRVRVHRQAGRTLRRHDHADFIPGRNLDEGLKDVDSASHCFQPHCG